MSNIEQYGAKLKSDHGTLIIYFSGHGSKSGKLVSHDHKPIDAQEIAAALRKGVKGTVGRLVLFIDACYSGHWTNGGDQVIQHLGLTSTDGSVPQSTPAQADQLSKVTADRFFSTMRENRFLPRDRIDQGLQLTGGSARFEGGLYHQVFVFSAAAPTPSPLTSLPMATDSN